MCKFKCLSFIKHALKNFVRYFFMYFCILKNRNAMKKLFFVLALFIGFSVVSCKSNEEPKAKIKPGIEMSEEDKALEEEMEKLDEDVEELDTLVEILKR